MKIECYDAEKVVYVETGFNPYSNGMKIEFRVRIMI